MDFQFYLNVTRDDTVSSVIQNDEQCAYAILHTITRCDFSEVLTFVDDHSYTLADPEKTVTRLRRLADELEGAIS